MYRSALSYIRDSRLGRYLSLFSVASAITAQAEAGIHQEPQDTLTIATKKHEYRLPAELLDELQVLWGIENGKIEVWPLADPDAYLLHGEEDFEPPEDINELGKVAKLVNKNSNGDYILTAEEIQKQTDRSALKKLGNF